MKKIVLFEDKIQETSKGVECTPYYVWWCYCGFIGFNKSYTNNWFVWTGMVLHIFGLRFDRGVSSNSVYEYDLDKDMYKNILDEPMTKNEFISCLVISVIIICFIVALFVNS